MTVWRKKAGYWKMDHFNSYKVYALIYSSTVDATLHKTTSAFCKRAMAKKRSMWNCCHVGASHYLFKGCCLLLKNSIENLRRQIELGWTHILSTRIYNLVLLNDCHFHHLVMFLNFWLYRDTHAYILDLTSRNFCRLNFVQALNHKLHNVLSTDLVISSEVSKKSS